MNTSKVWSYALAEAVVIVMLAGCSGSSSPIAPAPLGEAPDAANQTVQQRAFRAGRLDSFLAMNGNAVSAHREKGSTFMDAAAVGKPLIFVSNSSGDTGQRFVNIYLQKGKNKKVGKIMNLFGAGGLATDTTANLYIAEQSTSGDSKVGVYAPPYTGAPALTLDDPGFSYDVAVSAKGLVAVANICSNPGCALGSVTLYAKNSKRPCATVINPNVTSVLNDGFDENGNLYVDGSGPGPNYPGIVGEIKGGCQAKKLTLLTTTNSLSSDLAGVKVDKAGRIALLDLGNKVIDTYDPPKKRSRSLGAPVSTTPLPTVSAFAFAFRASGSDVYVIGARSSVSQLLEYDYRAGGAPKKARNLPGSIVFWSGVAVTPPLVP